MWTHRAGELFRLILFASPILAFSLPRRRRKAASIEQAIKIRYLLVIIVCNSSLPRWEIPALKAGFFKRWVGPSSKLGPKPQKFSGLKARVHHPERPIPSPLKKHGSRRQ